jgi:8-oxo-dGTP pyrophosphatase MutT (NUDIX family)
LTAEREKGTFKVLKKWTKERFPIYGANRQLIVDIERAAAGLFGIVTYGVQLIVYLEGPVCISIWAARRSPKKFLYPDKLGVTVGGSLPARETPFECLVRESHEEAGLSPELVRGHAKSVGTISYVTACDSKSTSGGEAGLIRAEVQFVYELKVDAHVVPKPYDMEASDISLYSVDEIKKALDNGEFTPANACLVLDFFIRHGLTTFDNEENYTQIISRLHRPLGIVTA